MPLGLKVATSRQRIPLLEVNRVFPSRLKASG
jgi:hypothetical protein